MCITPACTLIIHNLSYNSPLVVNSISQIQKIHWFFPHFLILTLVHRLSFHLFAAFIQFQTKISQRFLVFFIFLLAALSRFKRKQFLLKGWFYYSIILRLTSCFSTRLSPCLTIYGMWSLVFSIWFSICLFIYIHIHFLWISFFFP